MGRTEYRLLVENTVTSVIGVVVADPTINGYYYLRVISPPEIPLLTRQTIGVGPFAFFFGVIQIFFYYYCYLSK